MGNFAFNIAKGRMVEFWNRVDSNDPAASALIVIAIDAAGDTDATMIDRDDLSALLGGTANEVTNTNYVRKTLTDADITFPAPTDGSDAYIVDLTDITWTAILAGTAWTDLVICYDSDTGAGTDANIIPMINLDFAVTPDGSDITVQFNATGVLSAT